MNKFYCISIVTLSFVSQSSFAQLHVDSLGHVGVGVTTPLVSNPGYAPWRSDKDYYATVTIQGTELDGEHLRAQNYVIGSAIDSDYNTGYNSVAAGSDVTLEVGSSLTVTDNFTCPVGATMTIKPLETITY